MAYPFRFPPAPATPHVIRTAAINGYRSHSFNSPRSTPGTPTPSQPPAGDFIGRPITALEFQVKSQLRGDKIFDEFKAALQQAKTIATFEWKANKCQGKLVPVP